MKRILIVDDSEDTLNLIKMVFSTVQDLVMDFATSSREAIGLLNTNNYNACVLDVSLPDITGYYLGKLIRDVCTAMPIAFLTNYEGEFTKENADIINAAFWSKAEVFSAPTQLVGMIQSLASDEPCLNFLDKKIEIPEIIRELQ